MQRNEKLILALPKGRLLHQVMPVVRGAGIVPDAAFADASARQLRFATNIPDLDIIRVRSFDVATFVAFGAAHLGITGNDVIMEFDYPELYAPLDLNVGQCRISVAAPEDMAGDMTGGLSGFASGEAPSFVRVATKYPELTRRHFAAQGIQAECIKLNGAMELAPHLGLCRRIVDLVSSGATLRANGLVEIERICDITARLTVNRAAWKTRPDDIGGWITRFGEAINARQA